MSDFVIYVLDTETTGTDPQLHDIIEVSFWRSSDDEQKTWHLRAINESNVTDKALAINKHKKEDILWQTAYGKETYLEPADVIQQIESWVMCDDASATDRVIVGQNIGFDFEFLVELWKRNKAEDSFPFGTWIPTEDGKKRAQGFLIDTMAITRFIDLCTGKKRRVYNLSSLVRAFGITKQKAHKAEFDTKMTKELFYRQLNPLKSFIAEEFKDCYIDE